nr:MAG TPA: SAGA-associated factor 11-FINGER, DEUBIQUITINATION, TRANSCRIPTION FACTOR, SAGA [Caudoviricetes sp.]
MRYSPHLTKCSQYLESKTCNSRKFNGNSN